MSVASLSVARSAPPLAALFALTALASAGLIFAVEPMIAKMILPLLGGSPAVWNVSMAFFQTALLAGYLYAHLLQRLASLKQQAAIHLALLALAGLTLPLAVTGLFGPPPAGAPLWWLVRVLALSVGAPFAILSASAPLLQAWYARVNAGDPYVLYGASNLGSMLALLAYPTLIEPTLSLHSQAAVWSCGYGVFCIVVTATALLAIRFAPASAGQISSRELRVVRRTATDRLVWTALAAAPASLMLGVTTYISNDVASVPFLWVLPLALYLLTFIIAFQTRPLISPERALLWQTVFVATAAGLLCVNATSLLAHLLAYTGAFFFTALVCHQTLAARRPEAGALTEFYIFVSLGGVLGGLFNALAAPLLFSTVAEFPLVLALAMLARPFKRPAMPGWASLPVFVALAAALAMVFVPATPAWRFMPALLALVAALSAGSVSSRVVPFALCIGALCIAAAVLPPGNATTLATVRSFFGVHRVVVRDEPALGGAIHVLFHGTTIHGAEALAPAERCRTTTYYARPTPIGQTYRAVLSRPAPARIGVVGLGTGTVAAYLRAGDRMRFFEIDPEVERLARDSRYFSFLGQCARGRVDVVLGDARLTLAQEQPASFDLLQLDAFSSDTVPTHLLTVEAFRLYLRAIKPDGIILLHLSNRNLSLEAPAAAAAHALGAVALMQSFTPPSHASLIAVSPTQAMLVAKTPKALTMFLKDERWRAARDKGVRAWSDDYTNVIGALIDRAFGDTP
jgi:spermidine synthase